MDTLKGAKKYADEKAAAVQTEVDALEAKVGTVPESKTVVQMIEEAQAAATYDDAAVKADIKKNADAIGILNGTSAVDGSVDKKVADAINEFWNIRRLYLTNSPPCAVSSPRD